MSLPKGGIALATLVIFQAGLAHAQPVRSSFSPLRCDGPGPVGTECRATTISGNGEVVIGETTTTNTSTGRSACLWRQGSIELLYQAGLQGQTGGGMRGIPNSASLDGSVISGSIPNGVPEQSFVWRQGYGGSFVRGYVLSVSSNGLRLGGNYSFVGCCGFEPAIWEGGGPLSLRFWGAAQPSTPGQLVGMSADGTRAAGHGYINSRLRPWAWNAQSGIVYIDSVGELSGNAGMSLISGDGGTIFGSHARNGVSETWRWTAATGFAFDTSGITPIMCSSDAQIVIGSNASVWHMWTPQGGWRPLLSELLNVHGIDLAGWSFVQPAAISLDGRVIAGVGNNPCGTGQAWVIRLRDQPRCKGDFDGNGAVHINDIFQYLNAWFAGRADTEIDGQCGISIQDIFAFLNAWFAGCP